MESLRLKELGLVKVNSRELMVSGGQNWGELARKAAALIAIIKQFCDNYGGDLDRGFKDGWDSFDYKFQPPKC